MCCPTCPELSNDRAHPWWLLEGVLPFSKFPWEHLAALAPHYPELWSYGSRATNGTELQLRWLPNIGQPERQELRLKGCSPPFMMLSRRTPLGLEHTNVPHSRTGTSRATRPGSGVLGLCAASREGCWSSSDPVEEDSLMCHPREMNKASGVLTQDMPLLGKRMHSTMGAVSLTLRCELPSPAAATSCFPQSFNWSQWGAGPQLPQFLG